MSRKSTSGSRALGNSTFFLSQEHLEKENGRAGAAISGPGMKLQDDSELFGRIRQKLGDDLRTADVGVDSDFNLKRWLIACDYDVSRIVKKLGKHLVFRKAFHEFKMSSSDTEGEEYENHILERFYPSCDFGLKSCCNDRTTLVQILQIGKIDCYGLLHAVPSSVLIRSRLAYMESCFKALVQTELETCSRSEITWILDLEGLKYDSWTLSFMNGPFKTICDFISNHYVELSGKIILVNAGKFLHVAWQAIKPMIPAETKGLHTNQMSSL